MPIRLCRRRSAATGPVEDSGRLPKTDKPNFKPCWAHKNGGSPHQTAPPICFKSITKVDERGFLTIAVYRSGDSPLHPETNVPVRALREGLVECLGTNGL